MCDTEEKSTRRKDNIFVCDRCDNKYPIDHIKLGFEKSLEIKFGTFVFQVFLLHFHDHLQQHLYQKDIVLN